MSFKTVEVVLERSQARGSARMVLVVIAECANHDGSEAWPSIDTIAHRAGISRASVFRQLKSLAGIGELAYDSKGGRHGCNRYRVTVAEQGSQDATVADRDGLSCATEPSHLSSETVSLVRPEPSEPPKEPSSSPQPPAGGAGEIEINFKGWLAHHWVTTGMDPPPEGSEAWRSALHMYAALRAEGWQQHQLELTPEGAFANNFRRPRGLYAIEHCLKPTKIAALVEDGKQARARSDRTAPTVEPNADGPELWGRVFAEFKDALSEVRVFSYLAPLEGVALRDGTLTLAAPQHVRTWSEERYGPRIAEAATRLAGEQVAVQFVLKDEAAAA